MGRICLTVLAIFGLLNVVALVIFGMVQLFQGSILGGIYFTIIIIGVIIAEVLFTN